MALESHAALAEIRDTLLETYAINDSMNQLILSDPTLVRGAPRRRVKQDARDPSLRLKNGCGQDDAGRK